MADGDGRRVRNISPSRGDRSPEQGFTNQLVDRITNRRPGAAEATALQKAAVAGSAPRAPSSRAGLRLLSSSHQRSTAR